MSPPPLADGKASLDPLRSVQFSSFSSFSSVQSYNYFAAVILTTGKWTKGESPRMLVDIFGRPDMFC